MARANKGGWDFVKVGQTYQYKEDWFLAMVTIVEDKSNDDEYRFILKTEQSNFDPPGKDGIFEISHTKNLDGYYSGMLQLYEQPEYTCEYKWNRSAS